MHMREGELFGIANFGVIFGASAKKKGFLVCIGILMV